MHLQIQNQTNLWVGPRHSWFSKTGALVYVDQAGSGSRVDWGFSRGHPCGSSAFAATMRCGTAFCGNVLYVTKNNINYAISIDLYRVMHTRHLGCVVSLDVEDVVSVALVISTIEWGRSSFCLISQLSHLKFFCYIMTRIDVVQYRKRRQAISWVLCLPIQIPTNCWRNPRGLSMRLLDASTSCIEMGIAVSTFACKVLDPRGLMGMYAFLLPCTRRRLPEAFVVKTSRRAGHLSSLSRCWWFPSSIMRLGRYHQCLATRLPEHGISIHDSPVYLAALIL